MTKIILVIFTALVVGCKAHVEDDEAFKVNTFFKRAYVELGRRPAIKGVYDCSNIKQVDAFKELDEKFKKVLEAAIKDGTFQTNPKCKMLASGMVKSTEIVWLLKWRLKDKEYSIDNSGVFKTSTC